MWWNGNFFGINYRTFGLETTDDGGIPSQRTSNVVLWYFFDLSPNKMLNKHIDGRWFETQCGITFRRNYHLHETLCRIKWFFFGLHLQGHLIMTLSQKLLKIIAHVVVSSLSILDTDWHWHLRADRCHASWSWLTYSRPFEFYRAMRFSKISHQMPCSGKTDQHLIPWPFCKRIPCCGKHKPTK